MTTAATAPEGAAPEAAPAASRTAPGRLRPGPNTAVGIVLGAALAALAFTTSGGFDAVAKTGDTWTEIGLVLLGALACAAVMLVGAKARAWGGGTVALFAALTAWTAVSITWSVQPEDSWQSATQIVAYMAVFAGAAAMARLYPQRWPAVVGAVSAAAVGLSGYALLVRIFPATLDAGDYLGRLQTPFGYWNAIGVAAALGIVPCLWAGARRTPGRILPGLAVPGLALLITVVVLSYSRSAVLAAALGAACWFAVVPLRLRSVAVLVLAASGAAMISGWALSTHAITGDRVALSARDSAGHTFGIVIVLTLVVLLVAGVALAIALERVPVPATVRRWIGITLVAAVCLVPLAGIGALAVSSRGLTGEISHVWTTLTTTKGVVGDNPGRLLQLSNSRPQYWHEGITVGEHHLLAGVGAEGFATARTVYATSTQPVSHAHSYIIDTFADLGLIGVALSLALLVAWSVAAARPVAPRTRWRALDGQRTAEREGVIALGCVVVAFGVQSTVDWTWFFTGVAVPALVCAGWLAGRGPLAEPVGPAARRASVLQRPAAAAALTGLAALTLILAWLIWQPLRSADALSASLSAAARGDTAEAVTQARDAASIDPVSIEPLQILSSLYIGAHDLTAAREQFVKATQRQPDNPESWLGLGSFELQQGQTRAAYRSLLRAIHLNPLDPTTTALVLKARADLGFPPPAG